jgi:dienelactone hydrolase
VNAGETEPLACSGAEEGLQSALSDSKALITALRSARRADVDFRNITLFGHSRGGLLSVGLAAEGLPGVRSVVNFSGGWQTDCLAFNTAKFAEFAQRVKVPVLSFYGAYDSAWDVSHIKANVAALEKGGLGKGHILSGAGHNVFETHASVWAPIVFAR